MPSAHTAAALFPARSYHAVRMAWCRRAMLDFLRRWGIHVAVLVLAVGAGAGSAVQIVMALAAWLAMPLFVASAHGAWLLPAVAAQALVGAACVWGMHPLLWPARWAQAERALPIERRHRRRSDATVVALALTPLWLLDAIGAASLLAHDPAWLRPTRWLGLGALVLASGVSLALGVALLERMRRHPGSGRPRRLRAMRQRVGRAAAASAAAMPVPRAMHWWRALLWLPLWRGPARRSGRLQGVGSAALVLTGLCALAWPAATSWWLAAWAALALAVVTRLNALSREDTQALFASCLALPLQPRRLQRARACTSLWPLLPGGCALGIGVLATTGLRPEVLAAYAMACVCSCTVEVMATPADAVAKSSRWLFCLVLCVALASEVVA